MSRLLLTSACLGLLIGPSVSPTPIGRAEAGFNICAIPDQAFLADFPEWDAQVRNYVETSDQMRRRAKLHPGDGYRFMVDAAWFDAARYQDLPGFVLIGGSIDRHGCPRPDRIAVFVEARDAGPSALKMATGR